MSESGHTISALQVEERLFPPPEDFARHAIVNDPSIYARAAEDLEGFWAEEAGKLEWMTPWRQVLDRTNAPFFKWFIGGTLNVLLAARETGVPRVVYSSSTSVYGNPRYLPINEDDATNMLSPYAVSKFAGENYCKAFYESYGLSSSVVRYSASAPPAGISRRRRCQVSHRSSAKRGCSTASHLPSRIAAICVR